jgi:hypothetical protein
MGKDPNGALTGPDPMKILGRRLVKRAALAVHRPLAPLLGIVGVDAKALYEWSYWKSRQIEEGTLRNEWYVDTFTRRVGIEKDFYAGKKILDIGCGPRGSLEWAEEPDLHHLSVNHLRYGPVTAGILNVSRYKPSTSGSHVAYRRHQGLDLRSTHKVAIPQPVVDHEAEYDSVLVALPAEEGFDENVMATAIKLAARP